MWIIFKRNWEKGSREHAEWLVYHFTSSITVLLGSGVWATINSAERERLMKVLQEGADVVVGSVQKCELKSLS